MKIAVCLFGQLRDYKRGYECINKFMELNCEHTYDFFFHAWIDDNITYECAPWRRIDPKSLYIGNQNDVKKEILDFYKPLAYLYEKPLDKTNENVVADMESIRKSSSYVKCSKPIKDNIFNIYSQICTRSKVKDLFEDYITKTNTTYDLVITTRFDGYGFPVNWTIPTIDKNKTLYAFTFSSGRYIITDYFLMLAPETYVKVCNLYDNIKHIINNNDLDVKLKSLNEGLAFNAEEYLLANYLFCGYNVNDIVYMKSWNT
jgi:hypothetical protein